MWADALTLFEMNENATKMPTTVAKELEHLRRFADEIGVGPWLVQHEMILDWRARRIAAGWSPNTARVATSSVRAFYKWAYRTNRVVADPSAEPSRRCEELPVPRMWVEPLAAFRSALRGAGRSEETVRTRFNAVRRFAREHPTLSPWEVTLDQLFDWFGSKRWAAETRKLHRDALQAFYRWALDTNRTTFDPAKKLPPIRGKAPSPRPVPVSAYEAAIAKADTYERLALRLGAELGLRRGEVVQIHSRDIETVGEHSFLRVHGKGAKERIVPVGADLAQSLRARGDGWVFPGGVDGHMSAQYLGKRISDLLPTGVTMHALRHRFATDVYSRTENILATQQLLGHASPTTTQRYVQIGQDTLRELVEAVAVMHRPMAGRTA